MAGSGYTVTIKAVDQLTNTLDKINSKAKQTFKPFTTLGASIKRFSNVSGLKRVGSSLRDVGRSARDAASRAATVVAPLATITSAASIAGMYRLVSAWSNWGTQLRNTSFSIGITTRDLGSLQGAAQITGASAASLSSGMQTLGQNMYDAIGGRNSAAVAMFNTLGVSFRKTATQARSVSDVMPELADKIASIRDPYAQAQAAATLFGGAASDLLPFLRKGSRGIREYQQMAARYLHITDQSANAANRFRASQTRLTLAVQGLGNRISEQLSPVIAPLLSQFADWIATSPQVTNGISALVGAVQDFAGTLRSVDWSAVGRQFLAWGHAALWVTNLLGGPQKVLRDLFILMAGKFAISMIAPWVRLGFEIGKFSYKLLGLVRGAGLLSAAMSLVSAPVLAVVAAVGLLSVAGYEIYEHWKSIGAFFQRLWRWIGNAFSSGIATAEDAVGRMINLVPSIGHALGSMGSRAQKFVQPALDWVEKDSRSLTGSTRPDNETQRARAQQSMRYFVAQGWTPAQAAGITASLKQESGFDPRAVGDGGAAAGMAQWHKDRQDAIAKHFGRSLSQMDFGQQLQAVNWELTKGSERFAGKMLAGTSNALDAGSAVSTFYERPSDRAGEAQRRGASAMKLLSDFQQAQGAPVSAPAARPASGPPHDAAGAGRMDIHIHTDPGTKARVSDARGPLKNARVHNNNVTKVLP